ncbi:MAG: FIST N-terminal domain-containing protein [Limnohabitans sp.]|nr:FIST N-terminal domain-containing protein [Limnohabitans sp.]
MKTRHQLSSSAALSELISTRDAARDVAAQLRATSAGAIFTRPDILVVFLSFHHRALASEALNILRSELHPKHILATTAESVVWNDREIERAPGLSALALRIPGLVARPFSFDLADGPPAVWDDLLIRERVALGADVSTERGILEHRATLLLADPFSMHAGQACAAIDAVAGPRGARIMGGIASGASHAGLNVLAVDECITHQGLVGLSLFGDFEVSNIVSQGCRPVGPTFVVTAAHGNSILELGSRRAVDAAQDMVEQLTERERALIGQGLLVGLAPEASKPRLGRGDFLVRPVLGVDATNGSLSISDRVRTGMTVQFHIRDGDIAHEDLQMLLDGVRLHAQPSAGLLFTCNARGRALFGENDHDAATISRRLQGIPLAGFQCAGEIGPLGNRSFVHTQTASLVLFRPTDEPMTSDAEHGHL